MIKSTLVQLFGRFYFDVQLTVLKTEPSHYETLTVTNTVEGDADFVAQGFTGNYLVPAGNIVEGSVCTISYGDGVTTEAKLGYEKVKHTITAEELRAAQDRVINTGILCTPYARIASKLASGAPLENIGWNIETAKPLRRIKHYASAA